MAGGWIAEWPCWIDWPYSEGAWARRGKRGPAGPLIATDIYCWIQLHQTAREEKWGDRYTPAISLTRWRASSHGGRTVSAELTSLFYFLGFGVSSRIPMPEESKLLLHHSSLELASRTTGKKKACGQWVWISEFKHQSFNAHLGLNAHSLMS